MTLWQFLLISIGGSYVLLLMSYLFGYWFTRGQMQAHLEMMEKDCGDPDCPVHGEHGIVMHRPDDE